MESKDLKSNSISVGINIQFWMLCDHIKVITNVDLTFSIAKVIYKTSIHLFQIHTSVFLCA